MASLRRVISSAKPFVERIPHMAAIYRAVRDQMSLMKAPTATPWGFMIAGNIDMASGGFEPVETALVRRLLNDADVLVNVGANIGYYCCHALSMGKSVIAFEPVHRNLQFLCKNITINNWSGAEIYPLALSDSVDVIKIYGADTGASLIKGWAGIPENYFSLVPTSTMDTVIGGRLKGKRVLVIVDVEGAEFWMLEGATLLLANDPKPVWMVEITTKAHQPGDHQMNPHFLKTFQRFFESGYQAFSITGRLERMSMEDVASIARGERKLATHNFLFR